MGNCQAAGDAVGVTIQLPDGKVERLLWSVAARQVMLQYPGHYVALVPQSVPPSHLQGPNKSTTRVSIPPMPNRSKLKLLPPHGMLLVGEHYRLVSFEDVLSELSGKKILGGRSGGYCAKSKSKRVHSEHSPCRAEEDNDDDEDENLEPNADEVRDSRFRGQPVRRGLETMRSFNRSAQWRPALQSISEIGR
ncbi:hypothetical protein R1sor_016840 [Riccia sorocarpa]|uniref:Uncharacterized protein n=1 Tax=Riccia sorocarpa TaxID=122646 RepID=A0ABD3HI54_9MARC